MKFSLAALGLILCANFAMADLVVPKETTVISGPEASKIANLIVTGSDKKGTQARGTLAFNCLKRTNERHFTCSARVVNK